MTARLLQPAEARFPKKPKVRESFGPGGREIKQMLLASTLALGSMTGVALAEPSTLTDAQLQWRQEVYL